MKYRHAGKEKLLSIGVYPEVSLKEACDKRDAARAAARRQGFVRGDAAGQAEGPAVRRWSFRSCGP
ncbi:Arm DNA-binding domain-containing protein [Stenotrophomonas sepilia]|uniref:Arm DNA-binding domain-containing protein n=1 Tax=Stenotrophomonas TaxID=40323 RepID=UPI003CE4CD93